MRRSRFLRFVPLLAAALLAIWFTSIRYPQTAASQVPPRYVEGEILIKFKPGIPEQDRLGISDTYRAEKLATFRSGAEHWRLRSGETVERAVAELSGNRLIEYAEPNFILTLYETIPQDPDFGNQWALKNTRSGCTAGADIDATFAWDITQGSSNVVVAVIDSGIDFFHPDLEANVWINPNPSGDGCGPVGDLYGYDWANGDTGPLEIPALAHLAHGTRLAGIIGAQTDNILYLLGDPDPVPAGIAGVNWNVSMMALKIFPDDSVEAVLSNAVLAIEYATCQRVDLINASWGGFDYSQALKDAIEAAGDKEITFIAASGNAGIDLDDGVPGHSRYPASYDSENMIVVAATNCNEGLGGSNWGAVSVDLAAPGADIFSTIALDPNDDQFKYGYATGTSFAAPHVTGVAGLLRSLSPSMPAALVKQRIMETADAISAVTGTDKTVTDGRLNAYQAVQNQDTVSPSAITNLAAAPSYYSVGLTWTATGDDGTTGSAALYRVRYSTAPINASNWMDATRVMDEPVPASSGASESLAVDGLLCGTNYFFAMRAYDEWGNGPLSNVTSTTTTLPLIEDQHYCKELSTRCDLAGCGPNNCFEYQCTYDTNCIAEDPCPTNTCDC